MSNNNWVFLSYLMTPELSAYGNGDRIRINNIRSQEKGDSSNNSEIALPSHFGTHIDFPFHFGIEGKTLNDYVGDDFVFKHITIIDIQTCNISDYLISVDNLKDVILRKNVICSDTELLIVKTGFCDKRDEDTYWNENWGFGLSTAEFIKSIFPNLKSVAFDLISLSSYQQREIGRKAHKEFLLEHEILIIEDVDLRKINSETIINQIIAAPLRFYMADGAPITLLAKMNHE